MTIRYVVGTSEFPCMEFMRLESQLEIFIRDIRSNDQFLTLKKILDLSQMLVKPKMYIVYPMIYLLVKLALILPMEIAIEKCVSAMNFVKNGMWNCMGDEWLNGCLFTYIEKDIFYSIDNEKIVKHFQTMKIRMRQL